MPNGDEQNTEVMSDYQSSIDYDKVELALSGMEGEEFSGRSDAYRDSTLAIKYDHEERELERAKDRATLNLIGEIAGTVGAVSKMADENLKAWDAQDAGADALNIDNYEETGYIKKLFSKPPTDVMYNNNSSDNPLEVSSATLQNVGRATQLGSVDKLQRIHPATGEKMSLWDSVGQKYEPLKQKTEVPVVDVEVYGDKKKDTKIPKTEKNNETIDNTADERKAKEDNEETIKKDNAPSNDVVRDEVDEKSDTGYDESNYVDYSGGSETDKIMEKYDKKSIRPDAGLGGAQKLAEMSEAQWDAMNETEIQNLMEIVKKTGPGAVANFNDLLSQWGKPMGGTTHRDRYDYIIPRQRYKK
jgi:hypothetical protein